jgi:GTP-binding protein
VRLPVKIVSAEFITSATVPSHYPPASYPEIAFAGRSNVGKSSLINALVQKKGLAKTSNTPGRTRLINFFLINETLCFVDLPGYGYARVSEEMKREWRPMVEAYLTGRRNLRLLLLILDIRHDPGNNDLDFIAWLLASGIPFLPVVTKADKLSRSQVLQRRERIASLLNLPEKEKMIVFSAKTGAGRNELWQQISAFAV